MENCLKKMENPQLENLTKKLLIDQGNYFILPLTEINQTNFSRGKKFLSRNTQGRAKNGSANIGLSKTATVTIFFSIFFSRSF
jgi:hypothetical protein